MVGLCTRKTCITELLHHVALDDCIFFSSCSNCYSGSICQCIILDWLKDHVSQHFAFGRNHRDAKSISMCQFIWSTIFWNLGDIRITWLSHECDGSRQPHGQKADGAMVSNVFYTEWPLTSSWMLTLEPVTITSFLLIYLYWLNSVNIVVFCCTLSFVINISFMAAKNIQH